MWKANETFFWRIKDYFRAGCLSCCCRRRSESLKKEKKGSDDKRRKQLTNQHDFQWRQHNDGCKIIESICVESLARPQFGEYLICMRQTVDIHNNIEVLPHNSCLT